MTPHNDSFAVGGFFSREAEDVELEKLEAHGRFLAFFKEAVRIAQECLLTLRISNNNRYEVYAASLFVRLLECSQGVVLLAARGLEHDAEILLRSGFEALLRLRAACTDEDLLDRVLVGDARRRITLLETTLRRDKGELSDDVRAEIEARTKELQQYLDGESHQPISAGELAERLGQSDFYHKLFRFSSQHVHSSPFAIDEYFDLNDSGLPKSLRYEPRHSQLWVQMTAAIDILLSALTMILEKNQVEAPSRVGELRKLLADLEPPVPEERN